MVLRPMTGGMRTVTDQYRELLVARGVWVRAAWPTGPPPRSLFDRALAMYPYGSYSRQLREIIRHLEPDLLHAHGLQAGMASLRCTVPMVYTCHGFAPSGPAGVLFRILEAGVMRRAVALSATSALLAADATRRSGRVVSVLPVVVHAPLRHRLHPHQDGPVIGTLARLTPEKGLDILLQAFTTFVQAQPRARLLVGGDGPLATALSQQVAAAGLQDRVQFLGWIKPAAFYPQIDLYTQPSRREGLGLAAREAVAWGLPVVASRVGGLPEACGDGPWARYVPPNDASALATAWQEMLALDPKLIALAGRRWALSLSSPDSVSQALLDLYQRALSAPQKSK